MLSSRMWLCGSSKAAEGLPLELACGTEYVVGRGSKCHVRIHDLSVSRQHAIVRRTAEGYVEIEDLKSINGTFINGSRSSQARIMAGDRIAIGMVGIWLSSSPLAKSELVDTAASTAQVRRQDIDQALVNKLTTTQQRVLKLLLQGLNEQQIAAQSGTRPRTIHNHIQAIYQAFNVHSRQQLMSSFLGATIIKDESP